MSKLIISLFSFFLLFISSSYSQHSADNPLKRPHDWWQADLKKDSLPGISLDEAYYYLKGRKSSTVIVAVIDNCVDTAHEELKNHVWTNTKEIPNNGIDDDHNGYIDDMHGWCFIANKNNVVQTKQSELETLVYVLWKKNYENVDSSKIPLDEKPQYEEYKTAKKMFFEKLSFFKTAEIVKSDSVKFLKYVDHLVPEYKNVRLNKIPYLSVPFSSAYDSIANVFFASFVKIVAAKALLGKFDSILNHNPGTFGFVFEGAGLSNEYKYDTTNNYRAIIGDDPDNFEDIVYGTPSINLPDADSYHATIIAGIIAADRNNGLGMKGIADNVLIMPLITSVPKGNSISKDIVMAIRYAVDNGASVINMSFGSTPWMDEHEKELREAFDYAFNHDVLIVNSAGNDGLNLDKEKYLLGQGTGGKEHDNYIRVGSTTCLMNDTLVSWFSQFGRKTVDLFAPGSAIYSTSPGNNYTMESGTSFACPVVAGIAALLKSYFPTLTAPQMKEILTKSSYKPNMMVIPPIGATTNSEVPFSSLSKSGGIVNAYNAVMMADKMVNGSH